MAPEAVVGPSRCCRSPRSNIEELVGQIGPASFALALCSDSGCGPYRPVPGLMANFVIEGSAQLWTDGK
jgi:hypothetical protein